MRRTALWIAATVFVVVPALATDNPKDEAKVRKLAFKYASCVVRKYHDRASDAILATADNQQIMRNMAQIVDSDCLSSAAGFGVDMHFPNDTYKFALADALVNADYTARGVSTFADRLPLAQPTLGSPEQEAAALQRMKDSHRRAELQLGIDRQKAFVWLARYGECVVRHDPVNTRYWLLTPVETPEEISRIRALQSTFGSCLGSGTTMRFDRIMMRGTVAINYYRLAKATVVPDAGSSH